MRTSKDWLNRFRSCSPSSGFRPHRPSQSSWWWQNQSHLIQNQHLPLQYAVSHLPRMLGTSSSSTLHLVQRILLYWGLYFLQQRSIFNAIPLTVLKSMESSHPPSATAPHYVRVRLKMMWRKLWNGITSAMAASLFAAFTTTWTIDAAWDAASSFCTAAWPAADVFEFCAMIMYQSRVKHVSYCYLLVTSIWLVSKWVWYNPSLEPCQLHWVISPFF